MTTVTYTDSKRLPNSSVADAFFYNRNTGDFIVQFKSGRRAGYANVPLDVANRLWTASSAGLAYNTMIKNASPGYKGFSVGPAVTLSEVRDAPSAYKRSSTPPAQTFAEKAKTLVFTVTGVAPVTRTIEASTLDEAIQVFKDYYNGNVTVRSATVDLAE